MKTTLIIQARMGSNRLPGKILIPVAKQPLLAVIRRRTLAAPFDECWLATTRLPEDDVTVEWGRALGYNIFRGDTEDVLSRFTSIVRQTSPDWVLRLTADNPFVDVPVLNLLMSAARQAPTSVQLIRGERGTHWPLGYVPEMVRASALLDAEHAISQGQEYHRSNVTSWIAENRKVQFLERPPDWPSRGAWRWTVDTLDDHSMAAAAFDLFGAQWSTMTFPEMVKLLDVNQQVTTMNLHVRQKAIHEG